MDRIDYLRLSLSERPHEALIKQTARLLEASRACNQRNQSIEKILKTIEVTVKMAREAQHKIEDSDRLIADIGAQGLWSTTGDKTVDHAGGR